MNYDLPCKFRGEPTGKVEQCGCSIQLQPSYYCTNEKVPQEVCLMRIGARARIKLKQDHAECSDCYERMSDSPAADARAKQRSSPADPVQRAPMQPRPGDVYRDRQRQEIDLQNERMIHQNIYADSSSVPVDHSPQTLTLNMTAGGLGDSCLGLLAACGLKEQLPDKHIHYRCGKPEFVELFEGYDSLSLHDISQDARMGRTAEMQLNSGYRGDISGFDKGTRIDRYCRNIGADHWSRPGLKEPDRIKSLGTHCQDFVGLSPYSARLDREYPLNAWLELERQLIARGHSVVIIDRHKARCSMFQSLKATELGPEEVTGIVANLKCVIGNDSGIAHLSGLLGVKTIVLCGQTRGERIFSAYQKATWMYGTWGCEGCYWSGQYNSSCRPRCPSMSSILPSIIVEEVERG